MNIVMLSCAEYFTSDYEGSVIIAGNITASAEIEIKSSACLFVSQDVKLYSYC